MRLPGQPGRPGGSGLHRPGDLGDDPGTLQRFAEEHGLSYRLLSDPGSATARAWGAWGEKTLDGRTVAGPLRSTFVVAEDGAIAFAEIGVSAEGHVAELYRRLRNRPARADIPEKFRTRR